MRHIALIAVALAGIANLNASYIQIGGNVGLTSTTLGSGSGGTISTTGGAAQGAYSGSLWSGTGANNTGSSGTVTGSNGSVLCAGPGFPSPTCTTQANSAVPFAEPSDEFATANGVTFALLNQTLTGPTRYMSAWATANSAGTSSITIPIGIFGVTNVYTMLNDQYGINGSSPITVSFTFDNAADNETFTLVEGTSIRSAVQCLSGSALSACQTAGYANTLGTGSYAESTNSSARVSASNVWSGTYTASSGVYANTSGNMYLDMQNFSLAVPSTDTLVSMTITGVSSAFNSGLNSRAVLSAVTVQTAATPEPSTSLLLAAGLGLFAFVRARRKA